MAKKLLIAEDEKQNQLLLKRIAIKLGYSPTIVEDGSEALQVLNEDVFVALILDYSMPELNGIQTLEKIRESDNQSISDLPVIIVTGKDAGIIEQETQGLNVLGVLTKPFRFDDLKGLLQSIESA